MRRTVAATALELGLLLALLAGCSSAPQGPPRERLIECLLVPEFPGILSCDGQTVPWPSPGGGFVCHPLEQHEAYRERCQP